MYVHAHCVTRLQSKFDNFIKVACPKLIRSLALVQNLQNVSQTKRVQFSLLKLLLKRYYIRIQLYEDLE